jgi:hypothetical protein
MIIKYDVFFKTISLKRNPAEKRRDRRGFSGKPSYAKKAL